MGLFYDNKFTRAASGIGQGLLGASKSEGWAPALSRGLGLAAQNLQNYEDEKFKDQQERWEADRQRRLEEQDRRVEEQGMRDAALRDYQYGIANDPNKTPYEREVAGMAQYMTGSGISQLISQQSAAQANTASARRARDNRNIDAKAGEVRRSNIRTNEKIATEQRKSASPEQQAEQRMRDMISFQDPKSPNWASAAEALGLKKGDSLTPEMVTWMENMLKYTQERQFTESIYRGLNRPPGGAEDLNDQVTELK
jgi:hypothetical protein